MAPERIEMLPAVTKSEPNTPVYATISTPEEAPDAWFAPPTHKEKLAIMTIEHIPFELYLAAQNHAASDPSQYVSPRLLPLLDRMKFHFSRAMALARHEAENGVFSWEGTPGKKGNPDEPILQEDVMSSLRVEAFLAGIEEIKNPDKDNVVVFRRYWRILAAPTGMREEQKLGGVISARSTMKHHINNQVKTSVDEHWHDTPKQLIAEFEIGEGGFALGGRMLNDVGLVE